MRDENIEEKLNSKRETDSKAKNEQVISDPKTSASGAKFGETPPKSNWQSLSMR
jgi:hypothetical protein